jgi:hypothetical protein
VPSEGPSWHLQESKSYLDGHNSSSSIKESNCVNASDQFYGNNVHPALRGGIDRGIRGDRRTDCLGQSAPNGLGNERESKPVPLPHVSEIDFDRGSFVPTLRTSLESCLRPQIAAHGERAFHG